MQSVSTSPDIEAIASAIVDASLNIHRKLGPGLLEKIYEACLCYELQKRVFSVARQVNIPIVYEGLVFDECLRMDLLVENKVIVEVKSVEIVIPLWHAQVLSHLKMTGRRLGFLINFNVPLIKDGIKRIIL